MAKDRSNTNRKQCFPLHVLLVEGETEEIFYRYAKEKYLSDIQGLIVEPTLGGNFNIHKKIMDKIAGKYKNEVVRFYCCLDRESRYAPAPGFDLSFIRKEVKRLSLNNCLGVDAIIATQMIESWFFYDIEGIFRHLRIRQSLRNPRSFHPPEKFGKRELQKLFQQHGKIYIEGEKSRTFIRSLNLDEIIQKCREFHDGIELIKIRNAAITMR